VYSYGFFLFLFPLVVSSGCGSGRDEEPSWGKSSAWVQIRFRAAEFRKNPYSLSRQFPASADR
jgi:hypothetical protein